MKKIISLLAIFVLVLVGCTSSTSNACDQYDAKIGLVTDSGGINDKSFNQGTWEGIQEFCAENQVGAKYVESNDESQLVPNLQEMSKYEIVVASGFMFEEAIYEVATANPDTYYLLIDGMPKDASTGEYVEVDNITSFLFAEEEAGYLVGYVAGLVTETNKIGYIGGMQIPPVEKFGAGYIQGALAANPDVEIQYSYAESFTDTAKGGTMAATMYDDGVDIIFVAAGGVGSGVIEEGKKQKSEGKDVWVIGVDRDQFEDGLYNDQGDSVILTSAFKGVAEASFIGLEEFFAGTITPGTQVLTMADQAIGLPETNPNLSQEVIDQISTIQSEIADGQIKVLTSPSEAASSGNVTGL